MQASIIRRYAGIVLVGAIALTLAACGQGDASNDGSVATGISEPPAGSATPARPGAATPQPSTVPDSAECPGGVREIETNGASVTITGDCTKVSIDADNVTLNANKVDLIEVDGDHCTVTVGDTTTIEVDGDGNVVTAAGTSNLDVDGDRNSMTVPTRSYARFHDDSRDNVLIGCEANCKLVDKGKRNTAK